MNEPSGIVVSGAVGAGKTTVASEMSAVLVERDISHLCLDMDALSQSYPRTVGDPFGAAFSFACLGDVWSRHRRAGRDPNLILAGVVQSADRVAELSRAVGGLPLVVCRLVAPVEVIQERLRHRYASGEDGLEWHLNRAVELTEILDECGPEAHEVETAGRTVRDIALECLALWDGSRDLYRHNLGPG